MRLEGQSKLGYYPTPPDMVKLIKSYLSFPEGSFNAFDPCCGEGTALKTLLAGTDGKGYGVELDKHRANLAKEKLDVVLNSAIEDAHITEDNFSLLFLNPPYDWDESGERKETIFLAETIKYLMPEGILVFIIPSTQTHNILDLLTTHFEDIISLNFTSEYYRAYSQTVIFGKKKKTPSYTIDRRFYCGTLGDLKPKYKVPKFKGQIATFTTLNSSNVTKAFSESVWDNFYQMVEDAQVTSTAPLLPLREGHISLLLACGYLDGQVGGHVAKGTIVEDVITESTDNRIIEKTILKASIKILDKDGNIKVLS